MNVESKHLRYTMYVEGVLVPISSVAVTNVSDRSATLQVDVIPIPEAMSLTRGMKVHLFKQTNNGSPILKFYGLLKNQVYLKTFGNRRVQFEIGTMDCRWETMTMVEFSSRNLSSSTAIKHMKAVLSNIENQKKHSADQWAWMQEKVKKATGSVYAALNGITGQSIVVKSSANLGKASSNSSNEELKKSTIDVNTGRTRDISSLVDAFENEMKKADGNIPKGILNLIKLGYENANPYTQREGKDVLMDDMLVELFPEIMSGSNPLLHIDYEKLTKKNDLDAVGGAEYQKYDFLRRGVLALLRNVMSSAEVSIPMDQIVNQLMSAIFYKKSVDPTRISKSIVFHPFPYSYFPPKCNVVFPHEYNTLTFNPRAWNQPTRSIIAFPVSSGGHDGNAVNSSVGSGYLTILADQTDPVLQTISKLILDAISVDGSPTEKDESSAKRYEQLLANSLTASKMLTLEESLIGVTPNIKHINNPMLAGISLKTASMLANYFHQMAKMSIRTCSVRGALLDDMIVGLPVVVLDGKFSVHGVLDSYTYSVDENGSVSTDMAISCPKYIGFEELPTPALWLDNSAISPKNIGKYYKDVYGCSSVYETIEGKELVHERDHEVDILRDCITYLINKYNSADNKQEFADTYRAREHLTMRDVFETIHGCTSVQVSGMAKVDDPIKAIKWSGPLFKAYPVEKVPGLTFPDVDKQEIVVNLLKKHYNNPALIAD